MNSITRSLAGFAIVCIATASLAVAANPSERITPKRLSELTGPSRPLNGKRIKVEISNLSWTGKPRKGGPASITLRGDKPQGIIEVIREFRFPVAFEPPMASAKEPGVVPMTPTAFETVNTGWTIRLSAKQNGKLITVYGVADLVDVDLVPSGYGPAAKPIYDEKGKYISPNVLDQPRFETTTTRFHIFALPGTSTEIILYRGTKKEKHLVTVTVE